jgi:demethylmenaquinone methyltransferase/2-methoxy-6-polyprenyl-1,4-benzoquinol methylase
MPEAAAVNAMFARIARRYDRANRVLSLGIDLLWRRRLVAAVARVQPRRVVDLATGSGDVALALARRLGAGVRVTGMDFCAPMLEQAEVKRLALRPVPEVDFVEADALNLPLEDGSVDVVTVSFGVRNFADRGRGFREIARVLRPGGRLFVLEFSQPHGWFQPVYRPYTRHVCPRVAAWITGDRDAYVYLNDSIERFPGRGELAREMTDAGFRSAHGEPLTFGISALHEAVR